MTDSILTGVTLQRERVQNWDEFPFSVPCIRNLASLTITQPVCFFAGENGSGKSLHLQSHGESFLALFQHRFGADGFYLLDEPEAALSLQRQLSFLVILHQLVVQGHAQFFIATHSPIMLAYPRAQIFSFDSETIREVPYKETTAYEIASGFLRDPQAYLKHLLV